MPRKRGRRGAGSITRLPSGKFLARWSGGLDGSGKRIRKSATFVLRNDADWWLRQAGRDAAPELGMTVAEYLEQWLARKRSIRESTRLQYENHVRVHLIPELGAMPIGKLRRQHIEAFIVERSAHVSPKTKKPLSPSTVRAILVTLKSALEDGVPRDIPDNPAAKVQPPSVRRPPVQAMTINEARDVLAAFRGTWLEQLVRFLLGSGCRIGEALALNQTDVQDTFVRLRRSKTALRAVRVTDDGMAALREAIAAAPRRGKDEPVFFSPRPNHEGMRDRLARDSVNHAFTRILEENGLRHLSPHGLRHGTATLMLTLGAPMQSIADQLGHRNPGLTMRTYAHVDPIVIQRSLDALDEAVREG